MIKRHETKKKIKKTVRLGVVLFLVLSILSGCISLTDVNVEPVDKKIAETTVDETDKADTAVKEESAEIVGAGNNEKSEKSVKAESGSGSGEVKQQLVTPKVTEVTDDYVWSSILALQDKVERERIEKAEAEEAKAFLDGLFGDSSVTGSESGTEVETISDGTETEGSFLLVEEKNATEVYWGVLDPVEQEKVDSVTIMGDLTAVSVTGEKETSTAAEENVVTKETEDAVKDRIMIYRDGTDSEKSSTAPTWLYSDKEKSTEQSNTPVNVSIIQEAEKKEEKSTVTPEDILALSQNYQAGRVSEKKVSEMNSLEIYDKAMAILQKNYQYVFLAFAVVLIALLIKAGVKHLKSEKRVHKGDFKGKTFTPEETMVHTLNPMAKKSFSEILVNEGTEQKGDAESTEPVEKEDEPETVKKVRSVLDLFNRYAEKMDNGDIIIDTAGDDLTLSETVNLSGMLMSPAFG